MADTDLTGATKEIEVDTEAVVENADRKKKIVKYALLAFAVVGLFFLLKKFVFKK